MDEETDLANFALDYATKKGVSYAEARYEHQEQENFILKNGVLDALYVGQDRGVGVRVRVNGALGFAATNLRTKSDVRDIVDDAIKIAKASRRKTKINFAHEDAIEMNWLFFFSSRRRHTRFDCDWSSDVCSSDLAGPAHRSGAGGPAAYRPRLHLQGDRQGAVHLGQDRGESRVLGAAQASALDPAPAEDRKSVV